MWKKSWEKHYDAALKHAVKGKYRKAQELARKSINCAKTTASLKDLSKPQGLLGLLYVMVDHPGALDAVNESIEICEKAFGLQSHEVALELTVRACWEDCDLWTTEGRAAWERAVGIFGKEHKAGCLLKWLDQLLLLMVDAGNYKRARTTMVLQIQYVRNIFGPTSQEIQHLIPLYKFILNQLSLDVDAEMQKHFPELAWGSSPPSQLPPPVPCLK
jgi:hypothetical protein